VHHPSASFSVHILQGTVDFLHLWGQGGQTAADVRGHLPLAVDALVFLNVLGHLFGYCVMVSEQFAEKGGKFVSMLGGLDCFHKLVVWQGHLKCRGDSTCH